MTLAEVHVKWSVILMDLLGPDIFSTLWKKGQVLHRERAHLKVPVWSLVWNEILTKKALKHFYDQCTIKEPSSKTQLRQAEVVLTLNCFSFGDNYYKQTSGVAMGTKMGPSYANPFVGFIEHQFFSQYHGSKRELYGRYINDCIGATSSTREELTQFITAVNSFHPALKYT